MAINVRIGSQWRVPTALWMLAVFSAALLLPAESQAIPLYARQTGQNCLACHAGGQFPELTPYGRKFKLTGYTIGQRVDLPLAVMAVASMAHAEDVKSGGYASDPDPYRNGQFDITTASIFCCGKLTDNLGLFGQWTYDRFDHTDSNGNWVPKGHVDQVDLRYADRFIGDGRDLIVGVSLNNNPGVTDVWNTHNSAFTPVPTYVPLSNAMYGASTPIPNDVAAIPLLQSEGQAVAGVTGYAFLNNTWYAEAGLYKTAEGLFSFLNENNIGQMEYPNRIKPYGPYWRLAWNHDWGANSAMIGLHGMKADSYSDPTDTSSPTVTFQDSGIDGQYQYILDPHTITAMFSWTHERQSYPGALIDAGTAANSSDAIDYYRAKGTYVYQAKYGASLAYTSVYGTSDASLYASSPSGKPNSQLWVPELFWTPVQYVRIGVQYFDWVEFNGSKSNVTNNTDSTVRNRSASDNNVLLLYVWAAY